ncbi:hypothetical protein [Thermoanaerobacter sp. X514]|uniref:hypothetical protein n=1 Tax=Thermoanaerobacter sp. (strain X514) TaxID=399726 RepID=UPI0000E1E22E|nr:hypothetical protein [Thermoanaerobacter sp. X514]ABY91728.1 hypothetical protein Teth514_0418 [Thermoanaerobacter sp. X514]
MKRLFTLVLMVLLIVGMLLSKVVAEEGYKGYGEPTPEVMPENKSHAEDIHWIRIMNDFNGAIEVSYDKGRSWIPVGKVVQPAVRNNPNGYRASGWAKVGQVAASATNAIHIKVGHNDQDPAFPEGRGVMVSILPEEFFSPPPNYGSYTAADSGIWTNIPSGTYIFSKELAPFVGNEVYLERDGKLVSLPENWVPAPKDVLVIKVKKPVLYPREIIFENRIDGKVEIVYQEGRTIRTKTIARVIKPVEGVGRFEGTLYTGLSKVRANHTGVICISTAPVFRGTLDQAGENDKGGFQILPVHHSFSPEMGNAWVLTQWMIIGPLDENSPSPDGVAPLFSRYLRPRYDVEVRFNNGLWEPLPALTGRQDEALKDMTHVKILFPQVEQKIPVDIPIPTINSIPESSKEANISISGESYPGTKVEIYVNGIKQKEAKTGSDGIFIDNIVLSRGENIIQARAVDPAGRVSEFSAERKVILENVPQPPILDIPKSPTNYPIINVSGRAEPGSIITLTIYNENTAETTKVTDIRANEEGIFSSQVYLLEGVNVITAEAIYSDGTKSLPSSPIRVILDTIPPIISDMYPAEGEVINTTTPLISARVYDEGSGPVYFAIKLDGVSRPVTYDSKNNIMFYQVTSPLAPGPHTLAFYVKDAAGNSTRVPQIGEYVFYVESGN